MTTLSTSAASTSSSARKLGERGGDVAVTRLDQLGALDRERLDELDLGVLTDLAGVGAGLADDDDVAFGRLGRRGRGEAEDGEEDGQTHARAYIGSLGRHL